MPRLFVSSMAFAIAVLFPLVPAWSADWQQALSLHAATEYDSNPELDPAHEAGLWRGFVVPAYSLSRASERDELLAALSMHLERSSDVDRSESRHDPRGSLSWTRQAPTGEFGLAGSYDQSSTRITELEDSGIAGVDGTRKSAAVLGHWQKAVSERTDFSLNSSYRDVRYDVDRFTDHTAFSGGATLSRALSERANTYVQLTATRYEQDDNSDASNLVGGLVGVDWASSARLDWSARAGVTKVQGRADNTGWQGGLMLHYVGEHADFVFDAGRSVNPGSTGGFSETDQVAASMVYALDERSAAGVELSWRESAGSASHTVYQAGVWATRQLAARWQSRLSYRFVQRRADSVDASANVVSVSLSYNNTFL